MEKIAIITDSASDLSKELLDKYNIQFAPFRIIYSYGDFEDKINITGDEVYSSLTKEIPTTSLPSLEVIEKILCNLEKEGFTHVISINISSNLSGTANSVRLALEDHPKLTSYVFDTKTLCLAEGSIVLKAAKMVEEGKSFEEIIEALPKFREKSHCYFTLSTLEYLKKGGRIGKVAGTVGELLNLKPIIHVGDDGIYHTHAKVRGSKQSFNKMLDVVKTIASKGKCNIWVVDGAAEKEGEALAKAIRDLDNVVNVERAKVGPALGVHTGPGLFGVCIEEI